MKAEREVTSVRYIDSFDPLESDTDFHVSENIAAGDASVCLKHFYRILANQHKFSSHIDACAALLCAGSKKFFSDHALVLKQISDTVYEVQSCWAQDDQYFVGQHIADTAMPILKMHDQKRVVMHNDFALSSSQHDSKAYNSTHPRSYMGINLDLGGSERGLVCFISDSNAVGFKGFESNGDNMFLLELLAEGIASMVESQKSRALRKTEDLALFASGSLKSLEEYQQQAALPAGVGISSKVVDVLQQRIGHASLSIDNIADELNLSKRTLQRRLQQQGISFAELRDRIRFHYAIDYLVKNQTSIDRISSTLDFSDRTSFTNAFKRWTGLSPSTFRKVFRDYA